MKKLLALVVAATMGLSSVAFAAETTAAPAPAATTTAAPAKAPVKHVKKHKKAVEQKAQAAKKHHKATKPV
ncbi:acid resistance repetitive basic protein Asr, partial [Erwinia amylovora]